MKYIIVEDEFIIRQALAIQMKSFFPSFLCTGLFDSIADLQKSLNFETPDLLFMDVNLPDGCGFQFIKDFRERTNKVFPIIFITAYPDFESSALKMSQTSYLQKPIREKDIVAAVQNFNNHIDSNRKPN